MLNTELFIDGFRLEINIIKERRLLVCTYIPNKNLISKHLKEIRKTLDKYCSKYNNFIFLSNLNSETTESTVGNLCQISGCKSLIKDNTSFKNPEKFSCTDLIIL